MRFFTNDIKVFFFRHEIYGVVKSGLQITESDEKGNGKAGTERFFHRLYIRIFKAVQIGRRFVHVIRFHEGDDDAAFFCCHFRCGIAFCSLVEIRVFRVASGTYDSDVRFLFHWHFLHSVNFFRPFTPCFVRIAADHAGHFTVRIDEGVDKETGGHHITAFLHIFAYRVSFNF